MYVLHEYTETQRNKTQIFIYLFTAYLTTPSVAQNITPSTKLIPDNDLEEVQKEAVVTPFVVPSQNFRTMSEENNENQN